jgi:2-enoate reductase
MKLFEPGEIGKLTIKNRIVMASMLTMLSEPVKEPRLSQRGIDFYAARARGGVGLIITASYLPSLRVQPSMGLPVVNSTNCIRWLDYLSETAHDYGAKICVSLTPGSGRMLTPDPSLPNAGVVSASPVPCFWDPSINCRELTIGEIEGLIEDFEFSARVLSTAGIDAIEINAHQGYLIDQFNTALWNRRTDDYGGSLDGRLKFSIELVRAIRRGAGVEFPIIYRYGLTHYLDRGRTVDEGLEIARKLEANGVNALHIDAGCYETNNYAQPPTTQPPGLLVELAEITHKRVSLPIISVGKLGYPKLAECVLEEEKADFIALGRPLLADPEWPNKVRDGRLEDIIPCTGCHEGCLRRIFEGKHISCSVNPACGREAACIITPTGREKSVLVIGGGPAGMEAARVAALKGHKVTILEKWHSLGGNLVPAAIPDFKKDYKWFLAYLTTQIKKLGIETRLNCEATVDEIRKIDPDVVFIATGARPIIPNIPGIKESGVLTCIDALLGAKPVGDCVVIIGGGLVGCETGLWLAQQGKKVTIIARHEAMRDMYWINAKDLKERLDETETRMLTFTNILEMQDGRIVIFNNQGLKEILEADSTILAVGLEPNRKLFEDLQDKFPAIYPIGDCVESRNLQYSIWEAYHTARLI